MGLRDADVSSILDAQLGVLDGYSSLAWHGMAWSFQYYSAVRCFHLSKAVDLRMLKQRLSTRMVVIIVQLP
jgi:hypothetical protein